MGFPEDVTPEEIHEQGIFEFVTFSPTAIGTSEELKATFDTPGQWGLNCYDESGSEHSGDYVQMFTVTD